jgi:hypothetical protein
MTPTDQPSAPQIHHPRSPGSENWGSHCHLYPADKHNQINRNKPPLFDIISSQLERTNDARTTFKSFLRKCAIVATHYSSM